MEGSCDGDSEGVWGGVKLEGEEESVCLKL